MRMYQLEVGRREVYIFQLLCNQCRALQSVSFEFDTNQSWKYKDLQVSSRQLYSNGLTNTYIQEL